MYESGLTTVFLLEVALRRRRQDNQLIRLGCSRLLAHFDTSASKSSPLGPLPVKTVDRCNGANSCPTGKGQWNTGPFGVVMNHVRTVLNRLSSRKKGRRKCSKALLINCLYRHNTNTVSDALGKGCRLAGHYVGAGAIVTCNLMPKSSHTTRQFRDNNFDPTFARAKPLMPNHCDSHASNSPRNSAYTTWRRPSGRPRAASRACSPGRAGAPWCRRR